MGVLLNKNIIVAVTGSIAAYKSAELVRRLKDSGATVRVVMTRAACEFVTPMTFQALSGYPVHSELLDAASEAAMGHIELARWADIILIAPASANTLARLAMGVADDLLSTLCLATSAPIILAPAMNHQMWGNPATQANILTLKSRAIHIYGPASGEQACGEMGEGRMFEAADIITQLTHQLSSKLPMQGLKVMITAGPTFEDIDPVRFIGNRSSGKMGFAIASAAVAMGAEVVLVCGPVSLATPSGLLRENIRSAHDMHSYVLANLSGVDIFISAAAVADFRPYSISSEKIKKSDAEMEIKLIANPDILRAVALQADAPFTVGFAAETDNVENYARGKLKNKRLDMICANQVGGSEGGFEDDNNALELYWKDGGSSLPMAHKSVLAEQLLQQLLSRFQAHKL